MVSVEYVEKLYNRYSRFYDLIFAKVFAGGRSIASDLLELFPGAHLLEVGVGTGLSLPTLPTNIHVTGIDLSQKMLHQARKRIETLGSHHIQLYKMDATRLEFPENSFDRVLAAYFISTVPSPIKVIEEMKRVCRPGGYLVFLNHFRHEVPIIGPLEKKLSPLFYRVGFRTDLGLYELMETAGLEIDAVEKVGLLGHWKVIRCINRR